MPDDTSDIRRAAVPAISSPWVLVGPAIILLGMAQGSGELWLLPKLHADHGLTFTWIIFYGTVIQIPILVECMRTVALTGQNPLVVLARRHRALAVVCVVAIVFSMVGAAGFILTVGETFWRLFGWPQTEDPLVAKKFWALFCALIFALPVVSGRADIERYMEKVVGACSILSLLIFAGAFAVKPGLLKSAPQFFASLMVPGGFSLLGTISREELANVVVGFTYMGLGGWYGLFYPLWGRNRGIGMAHVTNSETGADTLAVTVADDSPENESKIRLWLHTIWRSTVIALLGNGFTVALTSLLAYSILFGAPAKIGSSWDIVSEQARFFEPILGALAPAAFTVAVAAFFADTWVGTYGSLGQLITEIVRAAFPNVKTGDPQRFFRKVFIAVVLFSLTPLVSSFSPGALLVRWMGIVMFCSMPLIGGGLLYLNYVYVPRLGPSFYRPSNVALAALSATTAIYLAATVVYIMTVWG